MPRVALTVSPALLADLDVIAERDAPGAPNRSATALRLMARALAEEKARGDAAELGTLPGWVVAAREAIARGADASAVEAVSHWKMAEPPKRLDAPMVLALVQALERSGRSGAA